MTCFYLQQLFVILGASAKNARSISTYNQYTLVPADGKPDARQVSDR